jgi:D-glycero-alpha-D-manno-heptose-7-phosphate kinase
MKISSKSPCRVDLAGGTLDIWPLYLYHESPVTVNFAVDRYTSCDLVTREDSRIVLRSRDLQGGETFASLDALLKTRKYRLPLAAWLLRFFRPGAGLELETHSEVPAGAGIAGSSSLMVTTASALNRLTGAGYGLEKIREICQNVEAQIIRVPTGCQDYYPAMYGGVNAVETGPAGIVRQRIPVDLEDFNQRIVLAYTGEPRNSGINNWEVTKAHIGGDKFVHKNFDRIAAIANAMRAALEKADWNETARLLREEWTHRRKNAPSITTPLIDRLVDVTRKAGARGAKACGAGGGGCVIFLVERGAKKRVGTLIASEGAEVLDVKVAPRGVQVRILAG